MGLSTRSGAATPRASIRHEQRTVRRTDAARAGKGATSGEPPAPYRPPMTDGRGDPRVGLVSPLPPQVGGVAAVAQWLLDHEQQIGCRYERFDLKRPAAAQAGGRLSFRAVLRQAKVLTSFVRWLPRSPRLLHYMVAYTPTGVTRDAALFLVARVFGRRTIAHVQLPSGDLIDEPTSSVRLSA